jgi:hypothetical protein
MSNLSEELRTYAEAPGDVFEQAADEIERLRAALAHCAASFQAEPGTVMSTAGQVAREFQRRLQIAAEALAASNQQRTGDDRKD